MKFFAFEFIRNKYSYFYDYRVRFGGKNYKLYV